MRGRVVGAVCRDVPLALVQVLQGLERGWHNELLRDMPR